MLKKRIMSALIAAAMTTSLFTSFAFADGTSVTIATTDNEAVTVGNTLKATVSGVSGNIAYQWYADDVAISGATEETFVPTYNQHKKAVKCVVTADGEEASSEAITVTSKFNETLKYNNMVWKEVGANGTADLTGDNSWEFSMTNEAGTTLSFSLLDTFNNSDAKYYIMANDLYGSYSTPGTIAKYDPTEEESMAYYVNTEFTKDTAWTWNLPKAVIDTLDYDHIWVTEKEYTGTQITSHYTYTAAVTVPAIWEMDTYKARIRFKVGGGNYAYLFRTPYNDTNYHVYAGGTTVTRTADGETTVGIVHGNDGKWWYKLAPQGLGESTIRIRPEFFVNENFFKTAKIDLATAGSAIIDEISKHSYEDLSEIYTDEEIATYLRNVEITPVVEVSIATTDGNAVTVGNTLKATVVGEATEILYQWYADDVAISGATEETFVPTYNQHKKAVKCVVTADGTGASSEVVTVTSKFNESLNYANFAWREVGANGTADLTGDHSWEFSMTNEAGTNLSFSLLDTFNNSDAKYYIIANDLYGAYKTPGSVAKYDPTVEDSMAYYVNTEFTKDTAWEMNLPTAVIDTLDKDHVWVTEKENTGSSITSHYTYTAAVTVPAVWEMDTYKSRIRFKVGDNNYSYLFRTPLNDTNYHVYNGGTTVTRTEDGETTVGIVHGNDGKWWYRLAPQGLGENTIRIRPEFFVNEDFFKTAKINLATAGAAVKQEIAKVELDVLKTLYTKEDLIAYLGFTEADFENDDSGNDDPGNDPGNDGVYFAEERTVNYDNAWAPNTFKTVTSQTADEDYVFTVKNGENNESFTLLDVDADGTASKYFVIANQVYGKAATFDVNPDVANYWKNPTAEEKEALENDTDKIAKKYPTHWLDGEHFEKGWLLNGATYKFGTSPLIPYIDNSHIWTCEPAPDAAVPNEKYTFTAGIALPSASELDTYIDRLGIADTYAFGTRTMINYKNGDATTRYMGVVSTSETNWYPSHWSLPQNGSVRIRPVCWLNNEFFANVKVDLATAGAAVKQEIKKVELAVLKVLYTKEDLISYLGFAESDFENDDSGNDDPGNDPGNNDSDNDGVYFAEERTVNYDNAWAPNSIKTVTSQTADEDYVFTVKNGENNESFTLLDVDADGTASKYFVIANQAYGKAMIFDANSDVANYWKNPTADEKDALGNDTDKIAKKYPTHWLDGEHFEKGWLLNGAAYKFGTSPLIPYIDNGHIWTCEPAPDAVVPNEKYTFTAGIALPSASELDTYIDRLGIADVDSFGTRTMINYKYEDTTNRYMGVASTTNTTNWFPSHWLLPQTGSVKIRPVCWLNDQFFANVKVDLATAGAAVKQEIANVGYKTLKMLYTEEELLTYLGMTEADDNDYVIKNVTMQRSNEGTISVSGKVKSNIQKETNAVVIVAIYDNEDIMVNSAATRILLERKGSQKNFDLTIESLSDDEYTVKIMLWDNFFDANAMTIQYEAGSL